MSIKKSLVPLIDLLTANPNVLVSDILDEAVTIASTKTSSKRTPREQKYIMDTEGNTVAIYDYYFKRWMPLVGPEEVEFGRKVSTKTGFNTMSKQGTALWNKQNSTAKQATLALIDQVTNGELSPENLPEARDAIEAARTLVEPTDLGFDSKEDVLDYLLGQDIDVAEQSSDEE